ncbi:MAG: hypothetical protein QM704_21125 [Anaeromyxobacteraceae bacterium]
MAAWFFWALRRGAMLSWRIAGWAGVVLATAYASAAAFRWSTLPPRESALVDQFRGNRSAYESLEQLLVEEAGPIEVAKWGVRTRRSLLAEIPPSGDFPRARFDRYLALLTRAGGEIAWRGDDACPETCVVVWAAGFAANTRHVAVCSLCTAPASLTDNLDRWWTTPTASGGREIVYRHLEAEWYLRADSR